MTRTRSRSTRRTGLRDCDRPGDIAPRRDTSHKLYVAVLSNAFHIAADTGPVITCPFVPGDLSHESMAMVVAVEKPAGALLPVQCLPSSALDEPIGTAGAAALHETATIVTALIS